MFGSLTYNDSMSNYMGCILFEKTYNCDCKNINKYHNISKYSYKFNFNENKCNEGCRYNLDKYFFPEFKVFGQSQGYDNDLISFTNKDYCNQKKDF